MTKTVDNGRFKAVRIAPFSGHHLWRDNKNGRLVISDHSADDEYDQPLSVEAADDGILYVDVERIKEHGGIEMVPVDVSGPARVAFSVPVTAGRKGERDRGMTLTDMRTVDHIMRQPEFKGMRLLIRVGNRVWAVDPNAYESKSC